MNRIPVSTINAAKVDDYKMWRATEHGVRDITIRHDLHALSTFFTYAIRHYWAFANPIDEVDIPSDADAERMHVLTADEDKDYFSRAARFPVLHDVGRLVINPKVVRPKKPYLWQRRISTSKLENCKSAAESRGLRDAFRSDD